MLPEGPATPISTRSVGYHDDSTHFEGYLAWPSSVAGLLPCVLLGHPWDGPGAPIRGFARTLATHGYAVFVVDVYGEGRRGDPLGDNSELMNPLLADRDQLARRMRLGLDTALLQPEVDRRSVVAVGHCFGGLCVLDLVRAAAPEVQGAVSIHGALGPPDPSNRSPMSSRILLLHGWNDPFAPPDDVVAICEELTARGATWELQAFGHAMHAFTLREANDPSAGIAWHGLAASRAHEALLGFLKAVFAGSA